MSHPGRALRDELATDAIVEPFLGIYDCFTASIAASFSPNLFLSGFGFAAVHYGLPDVGYIAWSDMVAAASRVRQILPGHRLLVDIDDGYVDLHTAQHVIRQLEGMGVAMVMLEDQARPSVADTPTASCCSLSATIWKSLKRCWTSATRSQSSRGRMPQGRRSIGGYKPSPGPRLMLY